MKILIYGDYWKWKSGYAREIRDILPFLKDAGHEVRQVALGYNGYPRDNDIVVYHTRTPEVDDYYAQEVLHYALDDFHPDIVLTIQDFFMTPKIGFALAHPGPWKWVHWGTLDSEPLDFYSRETLNWITYVFYHAEFGKREVEKINPAIHGEVLYPAVDPKVFHKLDKKALKAQFGLTGLQTIICNARGQQRKNVPVLMDAFKKVIEQEPKTVLILSSGISNTKTDSGTLDGYDLERFAIELGIEDNVMLPRGKNKGPIEDDILNIQYNLANINVLASWGEGFGLPYIEAGISEVPSVAVNNSASTEIVKDRGLLVEPRAYTYNTDGSKYSMCHPDDLADAILTLLRDHKLRNDMGRAAFEFASQLTPESRAKRMLEVFEELLQDDAQPVARRSI